MDGAYSRLIPIGAERMHVRIWDADGPTVMIAHGVTGTSADHTPLARNLRARGFRVIAPDAPGCGRSDPSPDPENGYGLGAMAVTVRRFLDVVANGPVHWVGASKGGALGIRIAGETPERIASLVLYDVGTTLPDAMRSVLGERLGGPPRFPDMGAFREHVGRFFERAGASLSSDRLDEITIGWSRRLDDGGVGYHYDPALSNQFRNNPEDFALWPWWDRVACPALIMRGERSTVLSAAELAEMAARNPRAAAHTVPGAVHVDMLDSEGIQNTIIDFIAAHAAQGEGVAA